MLGPDTSSSIEIGKIKNFVIGLNEIYTEVNSNINFKANNSDFSSMKNVWEKYFVKENVDKGQK